MTFLGSQSKSSWFLVNGEAHPRLHEAECHLHISSSAELLGEIQYVMLVCGATARRKRWFLSSVHVKCLSGFDEQKVMTESHRLADKSDGKS